MIDLYRNSQIYNMVAEGEVANLLAHFNSDYIMNVITTNIKNRFVHNTISNNPNLVVSFELYFKDLLQNYPSDKDNIFQVRNETYNEIIRLICQAYNLIIIPDDNFDSYLAALNLYDVFISNFSNSVVSFFSNYIYKNKSSLFEALNLTQYRKDKDSSILYFKKVYDDTEIGVLISKIKEVVYYISGFDIDLSFYLSMCGYNKETCEYITSIVYHSSDIFKEQFCQCAISPNILTDIRLYIQQILDMKLTEAGIAKPNIVVSDTNNN